MSLRSLLRLHQFIFSYCSYIVRSHGVKNKMWYGSRKRARLILPSIWSRRLWNGLKSYRLCQRWGQRVWPHETCDKMYVRYLCVHVYYTCVQHCGVMRQELAQFLKQLELKKRKILTLLPFLEFITWSLLKQDSQVQI